MLSITLNTSCWHELGCFIRSVVISTSGSLLSLIRLLGWEAVIEQLLYLSLVYGLNVGNTGYSLEFGEQVLQVFYSC